jgi:hypothetical protein
VIPPLERNSITFANAASRTFLSAAKGQRVRANENYGRTGMRELFSEWEDGTGGKLVLGLGLWFGASDGGDGRHGDDGNVTTTRQM